MCDEIIAEGDTVAARVLAEGTNLGALNGAVPLTGERFSARQSHWFFRVADGASWSSTGPRATT